MIKMTWMRRCAPLLISSVLVAGCSIFPEQAPLARYELPIKPLASTPQSPNDRVIYIATPQANRLINSDRILVQPEGVEIQVYQGALWADNVPVLFRDRMVQALQDAQLYKAISAEAALQSDLSLEGYINRFQVHYVEGQPKVQIHWEAQLVRSKDMSILQTQRFQIEQPTADSSVNAVVTAFGQATDQLGQQLVDWLATTSAAR